LALLFRLDVLVEHSRQDVVRDFAAPGPDDALIDDQCERGVAAEALVPHQVAIDVVEVRPAAAMRVTEVVDVLHVIPVAAELEAADGKEAGEVLAVVDVEVVQVGRLLVAVLTLAVEELNQRHSAFIVIVGVMPVPLGVLQPPRFRPLWPRLVEEEVPDAAPHEQNRQRHDPHLSRQIIERLAPVPHALLEVAVLFQQLLAPALRSHLISPALPAGHCRRCAAPLP